MEKVVILSGINHVSEQKATEVNRYLNDGWTVKDIRMFATRDCTTAIFVLEKK